MAKIDKNFSDSINRIAVRLAVGTNLVVYDKKQHTAFFFTRVNQDENGNVMRCCLVRRSIPERLIEVRRSDAILLREADGTWCKNKQEWQLYLKRKSPESFATGA